MTAIPAAGRVRRVAFVADQLGLGLDCAEPALDSPAPAFDIWQIVDASRSLGSVEKMVAAGNLSEGQIRLALSYSERFPEEIEEAIARARRPLSQLRTEYPFIDVHSPAER